LGDLREVIVITVTQVVASGLHVRKTSPAGVDIQTAKMNHFDGTLRAKGLGGFQNALQHDSGERIAHGMGITGPWRTSDTQQFDHDGHLCCL
jgi:hypothetical protein